MPMAYADFKSFLEDKYTYYLLEQVSRFVNKNHDGLGFHSINVLSICDQSVENLCIKSVRCSDMPGSYLKIEINLTAEIVTYGLGTKQYVADRKVRWFTVSVIACLKSGFEIINDKTNVAEFAPETWDKTTALDEFGVPYFYSSDLEEIADDFTDFYCAGAKYEDCKFPFAHVFEQLDVCVYEADLPSGTMGRMYFKNEVVRVNRKIYPPEEIEENEIEVQPGTMLISSSSNFLGYDGNNTITKTHELVHWEHHQKFFKILSLISDSGSIVCNAEPKYYRTNMTPLQKAIWFSEWQACSIGMRIAMPQELFKNTMNRVFDATKDSMSGERLADIVETTLRKVAELFGVSNYAVKQRAIQLGWDYAEGAFLFINGRYHSPLFFTKGTLGKNQTFLINTSEVERLRSLDSVFAELLNSGKFVSLGYVVCLKDEKYIRISNDYEFDKTGSDYELTEYAKDHLDECCLIFNWHSKYGAPDEEGFYGRCYLCRDVCADNRVEYTFNKDFEFNQRKQEIAEQIKRYKAAFAKEDEVLKDVCRMSFMNQLIYHMDRKHITVEDLEDRAHLSDKTIKKYRSGDSKPELDNLMAIFIGLNLPETYCNEMLKARGLELNELELEHRVYRMLIREHSDGTIEQWNEILKGFGLKEIPNRRNQKIGPRK